MKEERNIDDLFRSSFEDFEVAPPASVKAGIDRELGGKSSSRRFLWWFFALLLLIGSGTFAAFYSGVFDGSSSAGIHPVATAHPSGDVGNNSVSEGGKTEQFSDTHNASNSSARSGDAGSSAQNNIESAGSEADAIQAASSGKSGQTNGDKTASSSGSDKKASNTSSQNLKSGTKKKRAPKERGSARKVKDGEDGAITYDSDIPATAGGTKTYSPGVSGMGETIPPASDGVNSLNTEKQKQDSILEAKKLEEAKLAEPKKDSIEKAENAGNPNDPKKNPPPKPEEKMWMASVFAGPQFGINKVPATAGNFSEKSAFQFSGEINRSLFAGYGLSTGVNISTKRKESFEMTTESYDEHWELDSIQIPNPNDTTELIWVTIDSLHVDTLYTSYFQFNAVSSFAIPLYLTKHFTFGDNWGMLVNAGANFTFYKYALGASDTVITPPQTNDFSINVVGRLHATYRWNNLMFSAGIAGGYDLKPAIIYQERKRYYITPQFGVHWTF